MPIERIQVCNIKAGCLLKVNQDTVVEVALVERVSRGSVQVTDNKGQTYIYGNSQKVYVINVN